MEKKSPRIKMLLTPGEVAKRTGVAVSALHFYESKGLIHSQRNAGNQRRYRRDVLRAVAIIKIAQRIGIPLATIGDAFGVLPEGHNLSAKEWKMLSSQWREELDRRIHTLTSSPAVSAAAVYRDATARCATRAINWGKREPAPGCWKTSDKTKAPQLGALVVFRSWSFALSRWFARGFPPTSTSLSIAQSVDGGSGLRRHFNYGICRRFFLTILLKFSRQ